MSLIAAVSLKRYIGSTVGGGSGLSMVRMEYRRCCPRGLGVELIYGKTNFSGALM